MAVAALPASAQSRACNNPATATVVVTMPTGTLRSSLGCASHARRLVEALPKSVTVTVLGLAG